MSLYKIAIAIAALLLSACVGTARLYDAQVTVGVERRHGGGCSAPFSGYNLWLTPDIKLSVEARASKDVIWKDQHFSSVLFISVNVTIPKDRVVQLEEPAFQLSSPELNKPIIATLRPFRLIIYGTANERGEILFFPSTDKLVGGHQYTTHSSETPNDLFMSGFHIPDIVPRTFTLGFPLFVVDGKRVQPDAVTFVYREEDYWLCIMN